MAEVRQFEHALYKKNLNGFVLSSIVSGVYLRLVWLLIVTHRVKFVCPFTL
jgi:hypothetical protein